jgi:hypothetical protein
LLFNKKYALIRDMKKTYAIQILGGSNGAAAHAVGVTVQAISAWPDDLPATIADRVEAAYHRLQGRKLPKALDNTGQSAIESGAR